MPFTPEMRRSNNRRAAFRPAALCHLLLGRGQAGRDCFCILCIEPELMALVSFFNCHNMFPSCL